MRRFGEMLWRRTRWRGNLNFLRTLPQHAGCSEPFPRMDFSLAGDKVNDDRRSIQLQCIYPMTLLLWSTSQATIILDLIWFVFATMGLYNVLMDNSTRLVSAATIGLVGFIATMLYQAACRSRRPKDFPPGPPTLPIIGNLNVLPTTKGFLKLVYCIVRLCKSIVLTRCFH